MPPETDSEDRSSVLQEWHPRAPHLFVVLEGEQPTAGGLRCALGQVREVLIGRTDARTADCTAGRATIGIADRKVSVQHARIVREGQAWILEDAASRNGTFVNGERVSRRELADSDLIEVGRASLTLCPALPTPTETAQVSAADDTLGLSTLIPVLAGEHRLVERIAPSRVPVILLGETGTGKEVVARAIHAASRREGPFVAVNCAALTQSLAESQLFGHVKGAFSGAASDAQGFVRAAHHGTLFLDEIGDLPRPTQGVLLRVLQEGEVVPVGATRPLPVDVRVIAATHQPIEAMAARGDFRQDLLARLQGFSHRLWPLRARRQDLGVLVAAILRRSLAQDGDSLRLTGEAVRALFTHGWPSNVRELVNVLSRARMLTTDGTVDVPHLRPELGPPGPTHGPRLDPVLGLSATDIALRESILANLRRFDGNVAAVAREMKRAPMQIYRWMRRLGVDPRAFR
jgi:DNA-binding NtrC family response regulator